jgi:carbon-monoxide dehydrogenase catalytic subunit
MLRAIAAGTAAHGARGRESMLALKLAAEEKLNIPILGVSKIQAVADAYGIKKDGKTVERLAQKIANILLEDLSRTVPAKHKTLHSFNTYSLIKRHSPIVLTIFIGGCVYPWSMSFGYESN